MFIARAMRNAVLAAPFAIGAVTPAIAQVQDFPNRPIQIISPSAPGGGSDMLARLFARELEKLAGQPFVVLNRPGAGALVGTRTALTSRPDGYTLLSHASSAIVGNAYVVKDSGYEPNEDLVPIATLSQSAFALAVGPKSPAKSVAELTALLKAKKGTAFYAAPHNPAIVAAELYMQAVGVKADRVSYKTTTDAIRGVATGEVDFTFADMFLAVQQARAGRVQLLAVTRRHSASLLDPSLPTMSEAGIPNYEFTTFFGVWAPKGTPKPVIDKLSSWFQQLTNRDDMKAAVVKIGFDPLPGSAETLARMVAEDAKRWEHLIKSGILDVQ